MERATIDVAVLGPLRVRSNDEEVDVGGAKQQLVLLALVMADSGVVSTDRLIDLVWGNSPPAKPNVTLRSYISHLRRSLVPERATGDRTSLLVTRSPGYALELDDHQVDLRRFEAGVERARAALNAHDFDRATSESDTALALWRSDHLPVLEDVFPIETAHVLARRHEATTIGHAARLASGRHAEALPSLQALAHASPADEEVCRQLMLALYRSGRASEAIDQASLFRAHLLDDLGLEPTTLLVDLELQVLNNDHDLDWVSSTPPVRVEPVSQPSAADAPAGRDLAFARANDSVRASLESERSPLLAVVGEPGIGKTTLLNAIAKHGGQHGHAAVWGRCHDGGQTNTLWPWISILRDLFDRLTDDQVAQAVGHRAGELAALTPELATRLGVAPQPGQDALSLFDAIARTLRSVAELEPLVVILEDVHWADVASIKFLEVAVPLWRAAPIACLLSWRDTQQTDQNLTQALAGLGRLNDFEREELTGLDAMALCDLHRKLVGEDVTVDAIQPLLERTQGNPLFATELLRHGLDQPPSTTLKDAITERLSQLPPIGTDLLVLGALCRDGFTTTVLEAAGNKADDEVLDIIEHALASRLIETHPEDSERFQFAHALVQESLVAATSAPRRARAHARLGDFYEGRGAREELLAHHYLQGFNTEKLGAEYALAAADVSSALHDHASARDLLGRAIDVLDRVSERGTGSIELERHRIDLLIALGQQRKHIQDFAAVHSIVVEAFELADSMDLIDEMVIATLVYVGSTQVTGRFPSESGWLGYWCPSGPAIEMFETCLDRMPADHPYRPFITVELGGVLFGDHADPTRRRELLAEGIELARQSSDKHLLAHSLNLAYLEIDRDYSAPERARLATEIRDAAQAVGLVKQEVGATRALAVQALESGDVSTFHTHVSSIEELTRGASESALAMDAHTMPIAWALFIGEFEEAERLLTTAFDEFSTLGGAALDMFGIQFSLLLRERGVRRSVIDVLRDKVAGYPGPAYATPLALALAQEGEIDEARQVMADYQPDVVAGGGEGVLQFMTPWTYAQLILVLGDLEAAAVCRAQLEPAAGRIVAMNAGQVLFGSTSLPLGVLSTILGDLDAAEHHLGESLRQHQQLGARPSLLRTHVGLMELAHARGDSPRALEHHHEAEDLANSMGTMHWAIELATSRSGLAKPA